MTEEAKEIERIHKEHLEAEVGLLREHIKAAQEVVNSLQSHYESLTGRRFFW